MNKPEVVDIEVPRKWEDLTQEQLSFFFSMMNMEGSMEGVITRCFLKWGGVKVVGRNSKLDFLLRKGKQFFALSPVDMWQLMKPLYWLQEIPKSPVIIRKYGRHKAVDPLFKGVPFSVYLSCVAIWTDTMRRGAQDLNPIKELIFHLYGFHPKNVKNEYFGCVVYWMTSIQEYFNRRFPDLFTPSVSSDGQGSLGASQSNFQESMNAMIRALTKGDILKEKDILAFDTYRALVELDAQAKEARMINESIKKS